MNTTSNSQAPQTVEFLNQQFGNEKIHFTQVTADLIKVQLQFAQQACAEVHLQGAHLTRWTDTLGRENIFNSAAAVYQPSVPIRGGNPIIFPQFGPGEMCQHGFARNSVWRVLNTEVTADATVVAFELTPADVAAHYRSQWPHGFGLVLTISLGKSLQTQLKVHNPNAYALAFTHGFHTYLAVDDIHSVEISGLAGLEYMDNLRNCEVFREDRELVEIYDFIDRRYQEIPAQINIHDKSTNRLLVMEMNHCRDAFVWNPWQEAEKKLADLAAQSYQKFVCVEPGNMKNAVVLAAGENFISTQTINRL